MPRLKYSWFQIFGTLALLASAYFIVAQFYGRQSALKPTPKNLRQSERVLPAEPLQAASGPGIIEPRQRETKLSAASPGLILRIAVIEGRQIQAGQLIAQLDATSEQAALASAHEEVEAAKRELARTLAGERQETIAAALADMHAARARAAQSAETFQRLAPLAAKDLATRDELDRARRQAEQDQATAEASKLRYEALAHGPRTEDVALQEAKVAQAQRRTGERRAAISLREVRAPHDGTVLQVKYRPGEYFTPGADPLIVLGDLSRRRARIDIDERDIARVHLGATAYITASAYPGRRFPARVAEIGQRIGRKNLRTDDPKERIDTKILEVVFELEGNVPELVPGLRVTGVIESKGPEVSSR